ncbi:hypothetical protein ACIQVO_27385 [Streptomyces sp. NPDC101062]|uniref:hypothetical protein n=1 Tax=unclassified Streptomyces TaxID=2593676 RepID=UPI0038195C25
MNPNRMLRGDTVHRVVWIPGSDRLRGWCWCGASRESEGPEELWEWLLAHPGRHPRADAAPVPPVPPVTPEDHR